jgi:U6 snRNA-associated Sm-like protein LSm8
MSSLQSFVNKKVTILTSDGRTLTGNLLGHDQTTNLILSSTVERIFSPPDSDDPTTEVEHGLYLIRGDNVAICGLVDEEAESSIDWPQVKAEALGGMKHS